MGRCYEDWGEYRLDALMDLQSTLQDANKHLISAMGQVRQMAREVSEEIAARKKPPVRVEGRRTDVQGRTA